jgi:hypothetical protein
MLPNYKIAKSGRADSGIPAFRCLQSFARNAEAQNGQTRILKGIGRHRGGDVDGNVH